MTPIEREFAKLVGRVLGRRWFAMQQSEKKTSNKVTQGEHIVKHQRK